MSETTWGEGEVLPPKKKKVPTWLWFCGSGCLLAVVLAIVLGAWFASKFKDALDPEKQWPNVAEVLPFDERPRELDLKWGSTIGMDMFVFIDERGFAAILMRFRPSDGAEVRQTLMNPEYKGGFMGMGDRKGLEAGRIRVQGRDLEVVRFHQMEGEGGSGGQPGAPRVGDGESIMVLLTPPEATEPVVLQLVRSAGEGPITDEDVQRFLKPFHVGPDR